LSAGEGDLWLLIFAMNVQKAEAASENLSAIH